jgi:hypothetical protein
VYIYARMAVNKSDNRKKLLLEALEKTLGIVTDACRMANINRDTHYRWMREDEQYRQAVEDIDNITLDFVESKLHQNINANDNAAIIFYLKTKGKKRGYIERQEIDYNKGLKIEITDVSGKTKESIDKLCG